MPKTNANSDETPSEKLMTEGDEQDSDSGKIRN